MSVFQEAGAAVKLTAQIVSTSQFWASTARALSSPPVMILLIGDLVLSAVLSWTDILGAGLGGIGLSAIAGLVILLLLPPLMLHALAPGMARATVRAMELDLPEYAQASVGSYIGRWVLILLVMVLLVLPYVPVALIVGRFAILLFIPVFLMITTTHMRAVLSIFAQSKDVAAVVSATRGSRLVLWLLAAVALGYPSVALLDLAQNSIVNPYEFTPSITARVFNSAEHLVGMLVSIITMVLWTVFSMQSFGQRFPLHLSGRRGGAAAPAPSAERPPFRLSMPSAGTLALSALGVLLLGAGWAYQSRLTLMHKHLAMTDASYAEHMSGFETTDIHSAEFAV